MLPQGVRTSQGPSRFPATISDAPTALGRGTTASSVRRVSRGRSREATNRRNLVSSRRTNALVFGLEGPFGPSLLEKVDHSLGSQSRTAQAGPGLSVAGAALGRWWLQAPPRCTSAGRRAR